MKKYVFILLLIITTKMIGQENQSYNSYNPFEEAKFKIGGGVFIPQGKLKSYFGISPIVALEVEIPVKNKNKSFGIGVQLAVPNQRKGFEYARIIDTVKVNSKIMGNVFLNFGKTILKQKNAELEINIGIGASIITTSARNPYYSGKDDEKKYEQVSTLLVTPALEYNRYFNRNLDLTFGIHFQYSPYKIEGAVREDIGSFGFTPKILITF